MRRAMASACWSLIGVVVGHARLAGVHVGAAQLLGRHHLAGGRLHQRRTAEEDRPLALHDDGLVAHRRHVGAARGARAHHDGDLRNAQRGHVRLVVEDPAEVVAVGEHVLPARQVGAARIHQVHARQAVLPRDFLGADVLLHRHRVIGAALDGGVVGDDHAFAPGNAPHAGDDARAGRLVLVHVERRQLRQFEERRARVEQGAHALARQQLAAGHVLGARRLAAAHRHIGYAPPQVEDKRFHDGVRGAELGRAGVHVALDRGHRRATGQGDPDSSLRARRTARRVCVWSRPASRAAVP